MRRWITLALVALAACGGDKAPTSPASASIAGSYTLRTINGNNLPFTFSSGGSNLTVTSDVITLADGGTWSESFTYTQNGQAQTGTDSGTIQRAGTSIVLVSGGTPSYTGTIANGTLTVSDGSLNFVFSK